LSYYDDVMVAKFLVDLFKSIGLNEEELSGLKSFIINYRFINSDRIKRFNREIDKLIKATIKKRKNKKIGR